MGTGYGVQDLIQRSYIIYYAFDFNPLHTVTKIITRNPNRWNAG